MAEWLIEAVEEVFIVSRLLTWILERNHRGSQFNDWLYTVSYHLVAVYIYIREV